MEIKPVTKELWGDMERLFGTHGAYNGCWCMWWRITRADFARNRGEGNRRALKKIVDSGLVPGILGYLDRRPVAWCSVAPREQFPVLNRSPVLKKIDDRPVWSIVCYFIEEAFRGRGLSALMTGAAVTYAQKNGATIVEAYPSDVERVNLSGADGYMGLPSVYRVLGFREVKRRSPTRPILRCERGR